MIKVRLVRAERRGQRIASDHNVGLRPCSKQLTGRHGPYICVQRLGLTNTTYDALCTCQDDGAIFSDSLCGANMSREFCFAGQNTRSSS